MKRPQSENNARLKYSIVVCGPNKDGPIQPCSPYLEHNKRLLSVLSVFNDQIPTFALFI